MSIIFDLVIGGVVIAVAFLFLAVFLDATGSRKRCAIKLAKRGRLN